MDTILFLQASATQQGNPLMTMAFLLAAFGIIYWFMIRPQSQQQKKQKSFHSALRKGKKVVTIGGIHGTITEVKESTLDLLIAPKTIITIQRDSVSMDLTAAHYEQPAEKKVEEATA